MKHMNPKLTRLLFEGFSINTLENLNNDQLTVLYERVKKSKKETKEETTTTVKKYNLGDKGDKDKFLDATKTVVDKNKVNFDPESDTATVGEREMTEKSNYRKNTKGTKLKDITPKKNTRLPIYGGKYDNRKDSVSLEENILNLIQKHMPPHLTKSELLSAIKRKK